MAEVAKATVRTKTKNDKTCNVTPLPLRSGFYNKRYFERQGHCSGRTTARYTKLAEPKMWMRRKGTGALSGVGKGKEEDRTPGNEYMSIAHRDIGQLPRRGIGAEWAEVCMLPEG